ncbi:MAG: MaoC family dehydratase [Acidimicrobiales bacterium]|jgi:acyl dehydratase
MTTILNGMDELRKYRPQHLGYSDWHLVDQAQIDKFAEVTGDHQWIHVDPERAAKSPFGSTIAHGYMTLSLIPPLLHEVFDVKGVNFAVNYGCNRVRFPAPVKVDSKIRLGAALAEVDEIKDGLQWVVDITFEAEGEEKPRCVAQVVYRYYAG